MAKSKHYYIRKTHRWLGVLLGLQFLFWTLGGLYFSWSNMDEIHGDFEKKSVPLFSSNMPLVSPSQVIDSIKKTHPIDSVVTIQLIDILGKPFYQVQCLSTTKEQMENHASRHMSIHLANAYNGNLRTPLTQVEAVAIAKNRFNGETKLISVELLNQTNNHHEYRKNPLPAYAVTFDHPTKTTVYVSTELGTVQKFRNNKWRVFDFLWMMHTMDYEGRDHFGNLLLRSFSIFGLITVLSGFLLFFVSYKKKKSI